MSGYFLRADANAVQIEINNRTVAIKLNEVDSLQFASEEVPPAKPAEESLAKPAPTPDPIQQNARKAYAALLKLSEASRVGLPYLPYANLLIEVRPVIDESLAALPEGALKGDIAAAMEAYTDAGQALSVGIGKGVLPIATEPGASLMKKYSIKPAVNALGQEDRLMLDATLRAIWMAAGTHMNNIALVIKR